jgi:predicted esterase
VIGALLLASCLQAQAPLSAKDKDAFREIVTAVLREPDPDARAKLVREAEPFGERAPLAQLVALVREGPIVPAGPPGARDVGGKREKHETFGTVLSGLSFEHDGRVLRYAVDVPRGYDGKEPAGLLLDPGHGSGAKSDAKEKAGFLDMFRRHADAAGMKDWLIARTEIVEQIGADGLAGAQPDDVVAAAFDAFFRDVASRFAIDCDRVIANGLSQTGFWSWYLVRANPRRFSAILPMSAVTWEVDAYASNFLGVPIGVLHGSEDPICKVDPVRATVALLQRMGGDVRYVEIAGAKHDYKVWAEAPPLLKALCEKPRARYGKSHSFSLQTLHQPWCGPIRVDELEKTGDGKASTKPTAGVDVVIEGQSVRLHSEGVRALTLVLSSEEVDLANSVDVTWNGKRVHSGPIAPDVATLLWAAGETCDWSATREARLTLRAP